MIDRVEFQDHRDHRSSNSRSPFRVRSPRMNIQIHHADQSVLSIKRYRANVLPPYREILSAITGSEDPRRTSSRIASLGTRRYLEKRRLSHEFLEIFFTTAWEPGSGENVYIHEGVINLKIKTDLNHTLINSSRVWLPCNSENSWEFF